jgi:peptidoglycan/xylan/chitin deacetylase (PgdA/CDA1 family)
MRVPGVKMVKKLGRQARSRLTDHALILGYHRVAETPEDPYNICVSPDHFAEHLEVLLYERRPTSLANLVENLKSGQLTKQAVILTFDDGYSDFYHQVKPLLEYYNFPASVFVVTGYFGESFWWDRLEYVLSLPNEINSTHHTHDQNILSVYRKLSNVHPEEREKILAEAGASSDISRTETKLLPRTMTIEEVAGLAACDLIEVGSHTHSHPWMTDLSPLQQHEELHESKLVLEEILGREVKSFSYPNGAFTKHTEHLVRKLGFDSACSSEVDVVRKRTPLYRLPRLWVPDINGEDFKRWLSKW